MRSTNAENINEHDIELFQSYKQRSFPGHKKQPSVLGWNREGNCLMTAETLIKIWAFNEQLGFQIVNEIKGHDSLVTEAKFLNNNLLMTMSRDLLKVWDIRGSNLKAIKTEKKPKSDFISFAWKHDFEAPQFTVLFKDGQISSYDLRSSSLSQTLNTIKPSLEINQIAWDQTDHILFASYTEGGSGELSLYDSNLQQLPETFEIHNGKINSVEVSGCNSYLITCSDDSLLQIHVLPEIICTAAFSHTDTPYKKISISAHAEYAAVSCDEPFIHFYNIKRGGHAYKMPVTSSNQQALAWHPKKQILAFIDEDEKKNAKANEKGEEAYLKLFSPF